MSVLKIKAKSALAALFCATAKAIMMFLDIS